MGDTLIVSFRGGRSSDDHSITLRLLPHLDALSARLKVAKLSAFQDGSALAAEFADEFAEAGGDLPADAIQERWFDPRPALDAVRTIVTHLEANFGALGFVPYESRAHWLNDLMDELRATAALLKEAVAAGAQFRFLLLM
jgi:hypothetical protein